MTLHPEARILLRSPQNEEQDLLCQHLQGKNAPSDDRQLAVLDHREIVIGIDFGTSCTKVVIGDAALGRSFAVPFMAKNGVSRYLLPSRIFHGADGYTLTNGRECWRDLKLSLLDNPSDRARQDRVTAFLAYVIRYAKSWLLDAHSDLYARSELLWKVVIGLPEPEFGKGSRSELM